MTRIERVAEARRLRAEGLSQSKIARRLGVTQPTVWKWLNPESTREKNRRDNMARAEAKRAWARDPANRKPCEKCGAPTSDTPKPTAARLCSDCWDARVQAFRDAVIDGYRAGLPAWRIAEQTGRSVAAVCTKACRLRAAGVYLPYGPTGGAAHRSVAA